MLDIFIYIYISEQIYLLSNNYWENMCGAIRREPLDDNAERLVTHLYIKTSHLKQYLSHLDSLFS